MTWTKLPDDFTDSPEILSVSRPARLVHVEALVWCNKHLTDGAVPAGALRRVTDSEHVDAEVTELVAVGLWAVTDTGWQLDWAEQEPAARVRQRAGYRAGVQAAYRERRELHGQGDHSKCDARYCKKAVTGNATDHVNSYVPLPDPSRPVPTPREGKGQGQGVAAFAAAPEGSRRSAAPEKDGSWDFTPPWAQP